MDGNAIRSCVTPANAAQNHAVTTLEGLGSTKKMHPLQQAFVDEQAVQCGYCINGMIMTAKALLDTNPKPSDSDIKQALDGNLRLSFNRSESSNLHLHLLVENQRPVSPGSAQVKSRMRR
jgi:xanthine dehydrogenase iron-sulfur cluster and FAD-binding subunit A